MKARKSALLFLTFMISLFSYQFCYAQDDNIFIYEDGYSRIDLKNQPFWEDNTLYIPMEEMLNHYNSGELRYELPNIIIDHHTAYDGNAHIVFTLISNIVTINGAIVEMDKPLILKGDCLYLPIQYLSWLDLENSYYIQYEQKDNGLHVYLRNTALNREQLNWQNKDFGLEDLMGKESNIIDFSGKNLPLNFAWDYSFQTEEENDFVDNQGIKYKTNYITTNNQCKFYRDSEVYAVSIPFCGDYEITFICSDTINDEIVNQVYRYRDSKIKAISVSIPEFAVQNGDNTFILDKNGFYKQGTASNEWIKDIYAPVEGVADYIFQKPFYFIISDKEVSTILYKGWIGYVDGEEDHSQTKPLNIIIEMNSDIIYVNGEKKELREPAYISKNGYTMLPVRELTEVFSEANMLWNSERSEAIITFKDSNVSIVSGSDKMYINSKPIALKNIAEVHNGRMFISLRDMCQICNIPNNDISWNSTTKTVNMDTEI